MDGVWGGSVIGGEKALLGTPSSLTAVLYPALPPHPFLRLVLRLLGLHPFLLYGQFPFSPIPLHTDTQPGPNLYLYKSCKYVKFYPCALPCFPNLRPYPWTPFPLLFFGCCNYLGFVLYISGVCVCGLGATPLYSASWPPPHHDSLSTHEGREMFFLPVLFCFLVLPPHPTPPPAYSLPHHCPFSSTPSPISFFSGVCGETEKSCLINGDCSFIAVLTFLLSDLREDQHGDRNCFLRGS